MSDNEAAELLSEIEARIALRVMRWGAGIIASFLIAAAGLGAGYVTQVDRIQSLEKSSTERQKVVEDYQLFKQEIAKQLASLETETKNLTKAIDRLNAQLDK